MKKVVLIVCFVLLSYFHAKDAQYIDDEALLLQVHQQVSINKVQLEIDSTTTATCSFEFPEVDVKYLPHMAGMMCTADTSHACCKLLKAGTPQLGCSSSVDAAAIAKFGADLMKGESSCKVPQLLQESTEVATGKLCSFVQTMRQQGTTTYIVIGLVCLVFFGSTMLMIANRIVALVVGGIIESAIISIGRLSLGVRIDFHYVLVSPLSGRVDISNMKVHNPQTEPPFESPYLLLANLVSVDMNIWNYLFSSEPIEMHSIDFDGVHLIYEKPHMMSGHSNISLVRDHLHQVNDATKKVLTLDGMTNPLTQGIGQGINDFKEVCEAVAGTVTHGVDVVVEKGQKVSSESVATIPGASSQKHQVEKKQARGIIIHKLSLVHDGLAIMIGSHSAAAELPPIQSDDFAQECHSTSINGVLFKFVEMLAASAVSAAEKHAAEVLKETEKRATGSILGLFHS